MDPNNKNPEISIDIQPLYDNIIHNGKQISLISVSPNGTYVVTYSSEDNSIEGWIVNEHDSNWTPLKRDPEVIAYRLTNNDNSELNKIKVNDNKIVSCVRQGSMVIFQMSKLNKPLKIQEPPPFD